MHQYAPLQHCRRRGLRSHQTWSPAACRPAGPNIVMPHKLAGHLRRAAKCIALSNAVQLPGRILGDKAAPAAGQRACVPGQSCPLTVAWPSTDCRCGGSVRASHQRPLTRSLQQAGFSGLGHDGVRHLKIQLQSALHAASCVWSVAHLSPTSAPRTASQQRAGAHWARTRPAAQCH